MNKVICDVCGTAYPETANQCPICGSARVASQAPAGDTGAEETTAYTYVKGGRFSKKNVKNRSRASRHQEAPADDGEKASKGLIAVVIVLLIAIVAVVVYIGVQFLDFGPSKDPQPSETQGMTEATDPDPSESAGPSESTGVAVKNLLLSNSTLEFLAAGDKWTLEVELDPVDATDTVFFSSADPTVATVSETGEVIAVSGGETVITVSCGEIKAECKVLCSFAAASDPTDPSDPGNATDPTESTDPSGTEFVFEFNTAFKDEYTGKADSTFTERGYQWRAYKSSLSVDPADITWTSDNTDICTVDKGIVTMVGPGTTEIHAEYQGQTFTCIVRCVFKASSEDTTESTEGTEATDSTEATEGETSGTLTISHEDVTIAVDEVFSLRLKDADGNTQTVTWTADKEGYVLIEGNKITGVKSTGDLSMKYVKVSAAVDGKTYSCIVRVK